MAEIECGEQLTVSQCGAGDWVRLHSGWWRLGQPIAGGVGARPQLRGRPLVVDQGKRWPAILNGEEPVLERLVGEQFFGRPTSRPASIGER
ncbi:MAG: hypothetical protein KJO07_00480 [Deltaproteobacteria bacterium]|nr:hypothetical protein [Deltaproteobacteria bacterium]